MKNYDLQVSVKYFAESNLGDDSEPDQFCLRMRAGIFGSYLDAAPEEEAFSLPLGSVNFTLVRMGNALEANFPMREVFDLSQEMTDIAAALFDSSYEEMKPTVTKTFPYADFSGDLLVIESLDLEAFARGQRLGLSVIYRIIQDWESGCSLTVIQPHPERMGNTGDEIPGGVGDEFGFSEGSSGDSKDDLDRYFSDLGFKRIPESRFLGLPSSMARPPIFELALPGGLEITEEALQSFRTENQE